MKSVCNKGCTFSAKTTAVPTVRNKKTMHNNRLLSTAASISKMISVLVQVQNVQLLLVHLNIFFSTCTGQYEAHFETYAPYFDHYCFSMRPLNQF